MYDNMTYISDEFYVHHVARILMPDNSAPPRDRNYAPVNGIGALAFEPPTIQVGSEFICGSNKFEKYVVYLDYKFGYSAESKENILKPAIAWYPDDPGSFFLSLLIVI